MIGFAATDKNRENEWPRTLPERSMSCAERKSEQKSVSFSEHDSSTSVFVHSGYMCEEKRCGHAARIKELP